MDRQRPTVQMLGRYQPWHEGHTELFKRAHAKTGQVIIMVRDSGEKYHSRSQMLAILKFAGFTYGTDYEVIDVPNIVNITYGRDVGYKIEEERLPPEVEAISATLLRKVWEQ